AVVAGFRDCNVEVASLVNSRRRRPERSIQSNDRPREAFRQSRRELRGARDSRRHASLHAAREPGEGRLGSCGFLRSRVRSEPQQRVKRATKRHKKESQKGTKKIQKSGAHS